MSEPRAARCDRASSAEARDLSACSWRLRSYEHQGVPICDVSAVDGQNRLVNASTVIYLRCDRSEFQLFINYEHDYSTGQRRQSRQLLDEVRTTANVAKPELYRRLPMVRSAKDIRSVGTRVARQTGRCCPARLQPGSVPCRRSTDLEGPGRASADRARD